MSLMIEYKNVLTTCPYCGVGCGINLQVLNGELAGVLPSPNHPVSQGGLCIKGWNAHAFVHHADRLKTPLIREANGFREASWSEAITLVADKLSEIKNQDGSDSIGVFASAKCTNEENYLLQKFTRAVIGTNNIDHCARL
jgi:predicted molibdopterin-dependent oxidoreductase YjgC